MRRSRSMLLGAIAFGVMSVVSAVAQPPSDVTPFEKLQVEKLQAALALVAEAAAPTVVAIRASRRWSPEEIGANSDSAEAPDNETPRSSRLKPAAPAVGTGVILDANGVILTNQHVIEGSNPEDITCMASTGESYSVRSITSDRRSDLAILRIDARNLAQARIGDLATVKQGHFAIVMGNPYGSATEDRGRPAMSFGVISALGRPLTEQLDPSLQRYYGNLIQTDARISPGNSGGPLLNLRGEVIGIVTATSIRSGGSEGLGYAIPLDSRVRSIIAQLVRGEEVKYGFLGVGLDDPTEEDRLAAGVPAGTHGAVIKEVEPGKPADQARLRTGDLVVEFDGVSIQNADELIRAVGAARVGALVKVAFYREGKRQTAAVSPMERPPVASLDVDSWHWRGLILADEAAESRPESGLRVGGIRVADIADGAVFKQVPGHEGATIAEGAIIRKVDGRTIASVSDFRRQVAEKQGMVRLTFLLDGQETEIAVPPENGE